MSDSEILNLAKKVGEAVKFSRTIGELRRDSEAKQLWREVYPELSEGKPGLLGSLTSRAEAQVMRLACLFALLDLSDTIKLEHLSASCSLWAYCEQSARYIFGESLGDPLADEIKRVLDGMPAGMTKTDLNHHFKRHKPAEQLARALNVLVSRGLVYRRDEVTAGRTGIRYVSAKNYQTNGTP